LLALNAGAYVVKETARYGSSRPCAQPSRCSAHLERISLRGRGHRRGISGVFEPAETVILGPNGAGRASCACATAARPTDHGHWNSPELSGGPLRRW
jgi:hypothetical protein